MKTLAALGPKFRRYVHQALSRWFVDATLYEGHGRADSLAIRALFVNDGYGYGEYLRQRMYIKPPRVVARRYLLSSASTQNILSAAWGHPDICVVVADERCPPPPPGPRVHRSMESVKQYLDISGSTLDVANVSRKKLKEAERQIRKFNLTYRISNDVEDFDLFYYRMYLTQKTTRFGRLVSLKLYDEMRKYFDRGFVLFVLDQGIPVAGGLQYAEGEELCCRESGLLDANIEYEKRGAQAAVYYFVIQYARTLGMRTMDLRSSRPFLDDGPYCHKKHWGARVSVNPELRAQIYLVDYGPTDKIAAFYQQNPLVVATDRGLHGLVGMAADQLPTGDALRQLLNRYLASGMESLFLLTANSATIHELTP